jgi:hypothetical protein
MARIVHGFATSQSPLLSIAPEDWATFAEGDRERELMTPDGRVTNYAALLEAAGGLYGKRVNTATFQKIASAAREALQRLTADIADARPDAVILIADDQYELFPRENFPALAVYDDATLANFLPDPGPEAAPWRHALRNDTMIADERRYPGAPDLARAVIETLTQQDFDVAIARKPKDLAVAGLGHAWAFVINRLFSGKTIPVVPVLINTWYPPNVPSPARAFALGEALRDAVAGFDSEARIAIAAAGGLSHYTINEPLDRAALEAVLARDAAAIKRLPRGEMHSGSSQILDWIALAGAMADLQPAWSEYLPAYRTPAGTGIGLAFASWSSSRAAPKSKRKAGS